MKIKEITISGLEQILEFEEPQSDSLLTISRSFNIIGLSRGKTTDYDIDLKEDEIVELVFNDETKWFCNSDTIGEIFPEAEKFTTRSGRKRFNIPLEIIAWDTKRGTLKRSCLK